MSAHSETKLPPPSHSIWPRSPKWSHWVSLAPSKTVRCCFLMFGPSWWQSLQMELRRERERNTQNRKKWISCFHSVLQAHTVTGSSADIFIQQFASCELVPVDLIEFSHQWGLVSKLGKLEDWKTNWCNRQQLVSVNSGHCYIKWIPQSLSIGSLFFWFQEPKKCEVIKVWEIFKNDFKEVSFQGCSYLIKIQH